MSKADCDWESIEKGKAEGGNYSILRCQLCGRETAIGMGEHIRVEQFSCPFDEDQRTVVGLNEWN